MEVEEIVDKSIYDKINQQLERTYQLIINPANGCEGIQCLACSSISYNVADIKFKYCLYCEKFHE